MGNSRDIRFRAWSETRKKMISGNDGTVVFWPTMRICEYDANGKQIELPLMQYTGLKDNNGIDVFEGDVIKGDLFDSRLPIIGAVEYDDYFANYSIRNDAGLTPISKVDKRVVAGNIYEHPELLGRKP